MSNITKGYSACIVDKGTLKKEKKIAELLKVEPELKNVIGEALDKKGSVYGIKKKGVIKVVYIFNVVKEEDSKKLVYDRTIKTEDITDELLKALDEIMVDELKESVSLEYYSKVEWNDTEIVPQMITIGKKFNIPLGSLIFIIGVIIYVITDDVLWMCIGLVFGGVSGAVVKKK